VLQIICPLHVNSLTNRIHNGLMVHEGWSIRGKDLLRIILINAAEGIHGNDQKPVFGNAHKAEWKSKVIYANFFPGHHGSAYSQECVPALDVLVRRLFAPQLGAANLNDHPILGQNSGVVFCAMFSTSCCFGLAGALTRPILLRVIWSSVSAPLGRPAAASAENSVLAEIILIGKYISDRQLPGRMASWSCSNNSSEMHFRFQWKSGQKWHSLQYLPVLQFFVSFSVCAPFQLRNIESFIFKQYYVLQRAQ
jgi:hypothetical protein